MTIPTPQALDRVHSLATAAARFDELRTRDAMAAMTPAPAAGLGVERGVEAASGGPGPAAAPPSRLSRAEALELLALGEVIQRKAGYGRQLDVRTARSAGSSWAQIGAALGTSKQSAWEGHSRWIDQLAERHRRTPDEGFGAAAAQAAAQAARRLAGRPDADG